MTNTTTYNPALHGLRFRESAGWTLPLVRDYLRAQGYDVDAASTSFRLDGITYKAQWNGARKLGQATWTVFAKETYDRFFPVVGVIHDVEAVAK